MFKHFPLIGSINPYISICFNSIRVIFENTILGGFLSIDTHKPSIRVISLIQPVAVSVRHDLVHLGMGYGNVPFELGQLLITRQIISNGMKVDFSMLGSFGIFDKKNDSNRCATTFSENFASFLPRPFARCSLIAF